MARRINLILVACPLFVPGCGTAETRRGEFPFGGYPLAAVAYDFYYMSKMFGGGEEMMGTRAVGPWFLVWGLVSLPFDAFNDLLVLPIDVGAWVAGHRKPWPKQPNKAMQPTGAPSGAGG